MFVLLLGGAEDGGDDEAEETADGVHEAHILPEDVVATVACDITVFVLFEVTLEGEHHEEPASPRENVLDGEAPPDLEDGSPPGTGFSFVVGEGRDGGGEGIDSVEHNLAYPLTERESGDQPGYDPDQNHPCPEGNDAPNKGNEFPGAEDSKNEVRDPVSEEEHVARSCSRGSNSFVPLVDPGGTESLEDTEEEHEVDCEVVIDNIKVGEAPVEGEESGESSTDDANHQSDKLTGGLFEGRGVSHHS